MSTIAFLGMGAMGLRMAKNLHEEGHELLVWNRTPERCQSLVELGAKQCISPRKAAENAEIVIAMLTDDEASRSVWLDQENGAIHGLQNNTVAIECSTLSVPWCLELASRITGGGAKFIDAPVVGSRPQCESRQLIHLIGGEKDDLNKISKVLEVNAASLQYIGEAGSGMTMKLAVNGLFGMQVAALAETLGVLEKSGISKELAVNLLSEIPTTSPALKGIGALIAAENYVPLFPIHLVEKDFNYLGQLAHSQQSDIPCITTAKAMFHKAIISGYGKDNISGVAQLLL